MVWFMKDSGVKFRWKFFPYPCNYKKVNEGKRFI